MMETYIRFDWAMKRLLRNKANHAVLEGLMASLLGEKFRIVNFLESEANQEDENDKFNRADILAEGENGELVIFEIQNSRELTYFHRMLYGVSKAVTDYIHLGEDYGKVRKVYSVNIVYFSLGQGKDYVYHGKNVSRGMHESDDILHLSKRQEEIFFGKKPDGENTKEAGDLFPEYFLLKVNDFYKVATTPLDEWMEFLKTGNISADATAPGLDDARKCLAFDRLSNAEKLIYKQHVDNLLYQKYTLETRRTGWHSGRYSARRKVQGYRHSQESALAACADGNNRFGYGLDKGRDRETVIFMLTVATVLT